MARSRLRLLSAIGRSYNVNRDDSRNTKIALRDLGYFDTASSEITPYPEERMFQGIEEFQEDFDLRRDGLITPNGETVTKLNEALDYKYGVVGAGLSARKGTTSSSAPEPLPSHGRGRWFDPSIAHHINQRVTRMPAFQTFL